MNNRFCWNVHPVAKENNIISGDCWRFTVLTSRIIRLEYSKSGIFEDRASQSVFYRDFPECKFHTSESGGVLTINTGELILRYKVGEQFSQASLSVKLINEPASEWHFGEKFETLGGTAKTLDVTYDRVPLGNGVCSRFGFSVIDDSESLVLNDEGWVETRIEDSKDVFFFGYGYSYLDAVKDYYRLTGIPPLLPAYALGNWWSRYYKYTQQEYLGLMDRFKEENLPFTVAVIDMDWHIVDIPEDQRDPDPRFANGWTGYTWNEKYFPNYREFLKELHNRGLKISLNLHPAVGICPHEVQYEKMAKAMNITDGKRIPFDILSQKFMVNYFDILHHPYEEDGVDFWWMDWQQGKTYWWIHEENKDGKLADPREILDPLWMLNHLHILDISRKDKRPMFFSRFCGPGSQRYPIGFSGDTIISWEALRLQPYFTATASNIGYGWWSHDIGGHMRGYFEPELTVRWLQLGVFSPINRLHSSCDDFVHKEPWYFDNQYKTIMNDWLRLRHRLFPYLYTMNYRCHKELEPLVQPMYYSHPKCSAAYEAINQFWFGSELIVAPITEKTADIDGLAKADLWLPDGEWFDFFNGWRYSGAGGRKTEVYRTIENYPVFAKAGGIVPLMNSAPHDNSQKPTENPELVIFPGSDNHFEIYEDSGDGYAYKQGEYALTAVTMDYSYQKAVITVFPARGETAVLPESRNWSFKFRGFNRCCNIKAEINENEAVIEEKFSPETNTIEFKINTNIDDKITVTLIGEDLAKENYDISELCKNILVHSKLSTEKKNSIYNSFICTDILDPHEKLSKNFSSYQDEFHLIGAVRELLTLRQDEFYLSERYL